MHSLIDIIGGLALGLGILTFWLSVDEYIDDFVVSGQKGKDAWPVQHFIFESQMLLSSS